MPTVMLTPLEAKLLHLILNREAAPGEVSTGAVKLVESLRSRGIEAVEIERALAEEPITIKPLKPDYGRSTMPWGKHRGKIFADIPPSYLRYQLNWVRSDPELTQKFAAFVHDVTQFLNQG